MLPVSFVSGKCARRCAILRHGESGEDVQQVGIERKIGSDVVSVADVLFECAPLPLAAAGSERGLSQ